MVIDDTRCHEIILGQSQHCHVEHFVPIVNSVGKGIF